MITDTNTKQVKPVYFNTHTDAYKAKFKDDTRNLITPYKVVSRNGLPERFEGREAAMAAFHATKGRCLVSYNTPTQQRFIAYKFK